MIRRWEDGGSGRHIDIAAANNTVMHLMPLKDGGMLFAMSDPAFGIIDAARFSEHTPGAGPARFSE
jgi:hypothetical protein